MTQTLQSILDAAMALPVEDREILTHRLVASLAPPEGWEEVSKEEFFSELNLRHQEGLRDSSVCISAEEAHQKLEQVMRDLHVETSG